MFQSFTSDFCCLRLVKQFLIKIMLLLNVAVYSTEDGTHFFFLETPATSESAIQGSIQNYTVSHHVNTVILTPSVIKKPQTRSDYFFQVDNANSEVNVRFTPTIPHCSMATLIGLSIRVQLLRSLPSRFKVSVAITPGTHSSEEAVNKQLADKERVAAATENSHLIEVINQCIAMK